MTATATKSITEPARKTPVAAEVDVAVVGGGVAGVIAAIASARAGARTLLIEKSDHVGGYFAEGPGGQTVGTSYQDMNGKMIIKGIPWEFMERLIAAGGGTPPVDIDVSGMDKVDSNVSYDHSMQTRHIGKSKPHVEFEAVKTLAFEMLEQAGAELLLNTMTVGALVEADAVTGVLVENKSGRSAILATVVVDCSGDADVAAFAGAPFEIAPKKDMYQISRGSRVAIHDDEGRPVIVGGVGGSYDCGDGTDAWDLTRAEIHIRKLAVAQLAEIRKRPGFESCYIYGTGECQHLGVRETRRIVGEYMLTEDDVVEGSKFDDTIAKSANPVDMHMAGDTNENRTVKTDYHDIPYRSLVPKAIDGLLVAGRCISATHVAEAAIRKVPVCMATGQAAGTAAALSCRSGVAPRALDVSTLQRALRDRDAIV